MACWNARKAAGTICALGIGGIANVQFRFTRLRESAHIGHCFICSLKNGARLFQKQSACVSQVDRLVYIDSAESTLSRSYLLIVAFVILALAFVVVMF